MRAEAVTVSLTDPWGIAAIALGLFLGGLVKGATGAGMPVLAVPVIAAFYDVRTAVVVLVIPNLMINLAQVHKFRAHNAVPRFCLRFAVAGGVGAAIGTAILISLPGRVLNILLALIILGYVGLRLLKPAFKLPLPLAERWAWAGGLGGGVLQGTVSLSAPIAVTFANAIRLERPVFIFTLSVFFAALCVAQLPFQWLFGLMSTSSTLVGLLAMAPLFAGLPVGDYLGRRMSATVFDRTILALLLVLAARQIMAALG